MQSIQLGTPSSLDLLQRLLESLYTTLIVENRAEENLIRWTETIVEALFLHASLFGDGKDLSEELTELVGKIEAKVSDLVADFENVETLGGQIDSICE